MLQIIAGEDTITARQYLSKLRSKYQASNAQIISVTPRELEEAIKGGTTTQTLFADHLIYQTSGLVGHFAKKRKKKVELDALHADSSVSVIDWEGGKSGYSLGLQKVPYLKEFAPSETIFTLLNTLKPQKRTAFVHQLQAVTQTQDPIFVFTMIHRHVRDLIVLKHDQSAVKLHPFRKKQMISQAAQWETLKLIKLYEGLAKIDVSVKTSNSPFSITQSLEILACYYV